MTGARAKRKSSGRGTRSALAGVDIVTAPELAAWLDVTPKTVRALAVAGIVKRAERGQYRLRESVTGYCAHVRETASQRGGAASLEAMRVQRIRIARAQADAFEARNWSLAGDTYSGEVVAQTWADLVRRSRAAILAVPARCQQRLPHLTAHDVSELDHELRAALTELGNENDHAGDQRTGAARVDTAAAAAVVGLD